MQQLPKLIGPALSSLLLLSAGCQVAPPSPAQPRYDNLVIILIDTLRADHLKSYGYSRDTAPTLSRLASEGLQLNGYAASSWTRPSVATLLTGHAPQRHQAIARTDALVESVPYLPMVLRDSGFSTSAVVGNMNVARKWGFARGFDEFRQLGKGRKKVDGRRINREVEKILPDGSSRFFLYLHYVDPHDPYLPPRAWGDSAPLPEEAAATQPRRLIKRGVALTEDLRKRMVDLYDGEIADVDRAIMRFLISLQQKGLLDRTLVVVTSDHGEEFGEHGALLHGHTLYEEQIRVPLILWSEDSDLGQPSTDLAQPSTLAAPFFQVDLMSTLLDALGLPPAPAEGRSLWSEISTGRHFSTKTEGFHHLDLDGRAALAIRSGRYKLVHSTRMPHNRLFDLSPDPTEQSFLREDRHIRPLLEALLHHHNGTPRPQPKGASKRWMKPHDALSRAWATSTPATP